MEAVKELRKLKPNDQYLPSFVIADGEGKARGGRAARACDSERASDTATRPAQPVGTIEDGDAVVLFNFRSDRMVELSKAFEYTEEGKFTGFDRERVPKARRSVLCLVLARALAHACCC